MLKQDGRFGRNYKRTLQYIALILLTTFAMGIGSIGANAENTLDRIKRTGELRVGVGIAVPYTIQNSDGTLAGIEIGLFEKLATQLNAKIKYLVVGYDILAAGVSTDKYDMTTSLLRTEERAKVVQYSSVNLYTIGQVWMVRSDNPKDLNKLADLDKAEVTIVAITGAFDAISAKKYIPNATLKTIPGATQPQLVAEVLSKRADACGMEIPIYTTLYKQENGDQIRFIPDVDHPVTQSQGTWTFKKDDPEFKKYIDDFLAAQIKDGTLDQLKAKYINRKYVVME